MVYLDSHVNTCRIFYPFLDCLSFSYMFVETTEHKKNFSAFWHYMKLATELLS